MVSDTLGVKPDEPLTIGTYPWKTTHAMWLLERVAALEAENRGYRERLARQCRSLRQIQRKELKDA